MSGSSPRRSALASESCPRAVAALGNEEIQELLAIVGANWKRETDWLCKEFSFADFAEALVFVNRVGAIAEGKNHHPDIALSWGRVRLRVSTHSCEALSRNDFVLAAAIEELTGVTQEELTGVPQ